MKIYVNRLKCGSSGHMPFRLVENIGRIDYNREKLHFNSPVIIIGSVERHEDCYMVTGHIKTEIVLECSRCLSSIRHPIHAEFKQKYSESAQEDETLAANRDELDLERPVIESILLEIPIKPLCKEECKGLCPICGSDRNLNDCSCTHEDIDPRMMELKKLLEKK